ncbi:hypothetical protein [Candidatus Harpocratesius sp.]
MPSKISKILSGYKSSLEHAKKLYEDEYNLRMDNALKFFDDFLNNKLIDFSSLNDADSPKYLRIVDKLRKISEQIKFVAIDGTCFKEKLDPYIVFFSCAYAVRGNIDLNTENHSVKYEKWSIKEDKSVVSYLPVPYADLSNFLSDDEMGENDSHKIDFINIHLDLMRLAELYLAYSLIRTDLRPNIILLDQSISSSFNAQGIGRKSSKNALKILNKDLFGITLNENDVKIAYSHPYNNDLGIPPPKNFNLANYLIKILTNSPKGSISFNELLKKIPNWEHLNETDRITRIKWRIKKYINEIPSDPLLLVEESANLLKINPKYFNSWERTSQLFESVCQSLFEKKESEINSGMVYTTVKNGELQKHWFTPDDIRFFIAVAYRKLIEACWEHSIFLIGIAKDSSTAYFSKNYFEVFRDYDCGNDFEKYRFDDSLDKLPWTDRLLLEGIAYCKPNIDSPWCTLEMDSAVITLRNSCQHSLKNPPVIYGSGEHHNIYYPEKIFMRSLAQFYLNRSKLIPVAGHVIFIDRLLLPKFDKGIETVSLGLPSGMEVFFFEDNSKNNSVQEIIMFLLNILTKNLFPEVIGYPDPLHKADWGAKTLGEKIMPIIRSSQYTLKKNPLIKTLRRLRQDGGGR